MTASDARAVDVHALPAMLTALRLPSINRHWPALAERADKEGWPAARPSGPSTPFVRSAGSNDRVPRSGCEASPSSPRSNSPSARPAASAAT
jgi:hypothetical protein